MRKFSGTVLILGGVLALVDFAIWGTLKAGIDGAGTHLFLPLLASGQEWSTPITKLCFGLGILVFGLYLVLLEGDMGRSPLSLIFMINSLMLCFCLLFAFAAAQNPDKQALVGVCTIAALLQIVCGLFLLYFAVTERPVGAAGLSLGSLIYVCSAAVGAVVYLSGKAA